MTSNPRQITSADLFLFFFLPKKSFNKFHLNVYCIKQIRDVYCNRSQKTSQDVKNNSHATRPCLASYFLFFARCDVINDLLQYTNGKCNLFVIYIIIIYIFLNLFVLNIIIWYKFEQY